MGDAATVIVGVIIGASIFETTPEIARLAGRTDVLLALWAVGGLIAWLGALCYAELATRYPTAGGDVAYVEAAFGRTVGFICGWLHVWVIRPGSLGFFALAFGNAVESVVVSEIPRANLFWGAAVVVSLTLWNRGGVREAVALQWALTTAKVVALGAIVVVGWWLAPAPTTAESDAATPAATEAAPGTALILILYAFGGWNEIGYLGGELRDAKRRVPAALGIGLALTTIIYLAVNGAYVHALGLHGLAGAGGGRGCVGTAVGHARKDGDSNRRRRRSCWGRSTDRSWPGRG
ncbi:MAG: amino acid permease [Pirellulales bacterium]